MGCPVNPLFFELKSLKKISVRRFTADKSISAPKSPDEVIGPFNFTLHPGGASRRRHRLETVMKRKSNQSVVELVLSGHLSDIDVLHPAIKKLFGCAAKIVKSPNMAIQKSRQIAPFKELRVDPPGITENHRKKIKLRNRTVFILDLELAKIHLGLNARIRLKVHVGNPLPLLLEPVNRPLHNLVAPGKTHRPQSIVYPGRLVSRILFKPSCNVTLEWVQLAPPHYLCPVRLEIALVLKISLHRIAADAQPLRYLSLAQASFIHQQYVQNGLLFFQKATSLTLRQQSIS